MTPDNFIKAELAALCWREAAHYGGMDTMLAVAFVVRNRVRAGWGEWLDVIYKHEQWAGENRPAHFTAQAEPLVALKAPDLRSLVFRQFLAQIDDVYTGGMPDRFTADPQTGAGSLYYVELNHCNRQWFLENIARKPADHPRVAQVGPVSFFL